MKFHPSPFLESGAAAGVIKCLTKQATTATATNEEEHQDNCFKVLSFSEGKEKVPLVLHFVSFITLQTP